MSERNQAYSMYIVIVQHPIVLGAKISLGLIFIRAQQDFHERKCTFTMDSSCPFFTPARMTISSVALGEIFLHFYSSLISIHSMKNY